MTPDVLNQTIVAIKFPTSLNAALIENPAGGPLIRRCQTKAGNINGTLQRCSPWGILMILFAALHCPAPALAAPILGSAQDFAVLGASAVTNTGPTTIYGDLGISPGPALIVGFFGTAANEGPGIVTGNIEEKNAVSAQAQSDAALAYGILAGLPFTSDLTGQDLGGLTLTPGVYKFNSSAQLTGTLTLNAQNNPNAQFVFQIGSTLTTASASVVNVINGGANNGLFWQVGSSATLGTSTVFAGNILADQSITMVTDARITCGRAIALNAAVTMDTNTISNDCVANDFGSGRTDYGSSGFGGPDVQAIPEPGSVTLLSIGLLSLISFAWRSQKQKV